MNVQPQLDERRRLENAYFQGALTHNEYKKLIEDLNAREYAILVNTTRFRPHQ